MDPTGKPEYTEVAILRRTLANGGPEAEAIRKELTVGAVEWLLAERRQLLERQVELYRELEEQTKLYCRRLDQDIKDSQ